MFIMLIAASTAACGTGAPNPPPSLTPSPTPSPTSLPAATSYDEFAASFCSAFEALFGAVGNPDTAAWSEPSLALDAAVAAHDGVAADRLAEQIIGELESGRRDVAIGGGWPPGAPVMDQLDRVFVAFEAWTTAKVALAKGGPGAIDPQVAFEGAGGVEAWHAMFEAGRAMSSQRPGEGHHCANVPIGI